MKKRKRDGGYLPGDRSPRGLARRFLLEQISPYLAMKKRNATAGTSLEIVRPEALRGVSFWSRHPAVAWSQQRGVSRLEKGGRNPDSQTPPILKFPIPNCSGPKAPQRKHGFA